MLIVFIFYYDIIQHTIINHIFVLNLYDLNTYSNNNIFFMIHCLWVKRKLIRNVASGQLIDSTSSGRLILPTFLQASILMLRMITNIIVWSSQVYICNIERSKNIKHKCIIPFYIATLSTNKTRFTFSYFIVIYFMCY